MGKRSISTWAGAACALLIAGTATGTAAPARPPSYTTGAPRAGSPSRPGGASAGEELRTLNETVAKLRHQVENHEVQLAMVEERLKGCQEGSEDVYERCQLLQADLDRYLRQTDGLSERVYSLEGEQSADETGKRCAQLEQTLAGIDQRLKQHDEALAALKSALGNLVTFLEKEHGGTITATGGGKDLRYRVVEGDSLGKIAIKHKTKVEEIKRLNGLTDDKITVGQTLRLPEGADR